MFNYESRIENARKVINEADYILIGAGAGLSTAAGLEYSGDKFKNNFGDFINKYHFTDLYTATFYDFQTQEEKWAFWARLINLNRYNKEPLKLYSEIFNLIKDKDYFVLTTNVDAQFEIAGFNKENIFATEDYILCSGDNPVMLVAHMDTVFPETTRNIMDIYYDQSQQVLWSPDGLGTDDRAGIWIILQILKSGYHPHIIFTCDEEKGGDGAIALAQKPCPFSKLKYIIELDRMGADDCVFYDCENPKFTNFIKKYGFTQSIGTFTDISFLCPYWEVAGVNLSVGYLDEHTHSERLFFYWTKQTLIKVKRMLDTADRASYFKYIPASQKFRRKYTLGAESYR